MDPKLKAILQKAKMVDEKAKAYDTVNKTNMPTNNTTQSSSGMYEQMNMGTQITNTAQQIKPGTETYNKRVTESKLPPEIQKAMLETPIQQADMPGTFSLDEEAIKEINPKYGRPHINETIQNVEMVKGPTQKGFDTHVLKKMIAEEIAKALPSIVERYFDKKMIKENIEVLKSLKIKRKTTNNRK